MQVHSASLPLGCAEDSAQLLSVARQALPAVRLGLIACLLEHFLAEVHLDARCTTSTSGDMNRASFDAASTLTLAPRVGAEIAKKQIAAAGRVAAPAAGASIRMLLNACHRIIR